MNLYDVEVKVGLAAELQVDTTKYNSGMAIDLKKFNLSLDVQFIKENDEVSMDILEFRQSFDIIEVKIEDSKLQEMWDLLFNTEMMQEFILEDIIHHYFIKRLPVFNLKNLIQVPVKDKKLNVSIVEIPGLSQIRNEQFINLGMGIEIVAPEYQAKYPKLNSLWEMSFNKFVPNKKNVGRGKLLTDLLSKNPIDSDMLQKIQIQVSSEMVMKLGRDLMGELDVDLSTVKALDNILIIKNLRLIFPKLREYYTSQDSKVNIQLKLSVQSNSPNMYYNLNSK